jgi:hypothetical protein
LRATDHGVPAVYLTHAFLAGLSGRRAAEILFRFEVNRAVAYSMPNVPEDLLRGPTLMGDPGHTPTNPAVTKAKLQATTGELYSKAIAGE